MDYIEKLSRFQDLCAASCGEIWQRVADLSIPLKANFHTVSTCEKVKSEKAIGTEFDVTTVFPYGENIKIVGGHSQFTPDVVLKSGTVMILPLKSTVLQSTNFNSEND